MPREIRLSTLVPRPFPTFLLVLFFSLLALYCTANQFSIYEHWDELGKAEIRSARASGILIIRNFCYLAPARCWR